MVKGIAEKHDLVKLLSLSDAFLHWHLSEPHRSLGTECALVQGPYLACSQAMENGP